MYLFNHKLTQTYYGELQLLCPNGRHIALVLDIRTGWVAVRIELDIQDTGNAIALQLSLR
jgi:hypothetical protein